MPRLLILLAMGGHMLTRCGTINSATRERMHFYNWPVLSASFLSMNGASSGHTDISYFNTNKKKVLHGTSSLKVIQTFFRLYASIYCL